MEYNGQYSGMFSAGSPETEHRQYRCLESLKVKISSLDRFKYVIVHL